MFNDDINDLLKYAVECGLVNNHDKVYITNLLLDLFHEREFEYIEKENVRDLEEILNSLLIFAVEKGIIKDNIVSKDLFDVEIMNLITPKPSIVIEEFYKKYKVSSKNATDYYYKLSKETNYIRENRIKKDRKWVVDSSYGEIEICINLSKPEIDPKDIIERSKLKVSSYPKCMLCKENEGFTGNINYPSKKNLRLIPIELEGENWYLQYSPYVYYNEHCILFTEEHKPMVVDENTIMYLTEFVKLFPHYFLGSNASLPIVGGSILTHMHYQGGNYEFPIFKAISEKKIIIKDFEKTQVEILKWPMTTMKIVSEKQEDIIKVGNRVLKFWEKYSDKSSNIYSTTNGERHNTITPIVRRNKENYELYIIFRNNLTTEERPLGYFHPREEYHSIKKENIGLIEAMGYAILPGRLNKELEIVKEYILQGIVKNKEIVEKYKLLIDRVEKHENIGNENIDKIVEKEVGYIFIKILEDANVFKDNENGIYKFIDELNRL